MKIWDQKVQAGSPLARLTRLQDAVLERDPASELSS
jgi:hypothetical protein